MARQPAKHAQPSPVVAQIQGGLIGIEPDGIVGWAWDRANPDAPVQVRLMAGAQLVAEAVANQFEDERVRTLVGPGIAGFITRLAAAPAGRYPLQLSLHDLSGTPLGASLPVASPAEIAGLIGLQSTATYEGNTDGIYDGTLKGWARDTADPDHALELELLDAGAPVAYANANMLREDLRQAGLHHGLYGFSFDLPVSLLDGRTHSLSVRIAATAITLRGGPIAFGPLATSALVSQLSALQGEVAGLRQQIAGLIAPDGPVQRRMLRTLAERVAAQAEIQHEQMERDMDALRAMVFAAAERAAETATGPEQYATTAARPRRR
jgi:hypothetical protein